MRTSTTTTLAVAALTAVLAAGCGSDAGTDATDSDPPTSTTTSTTSTAGATDGSDPSPATEVSESAEPTQEAVVPTIATKPFCTKVDPAAISAVDGSRPPAELLTDRKPGESYTVFDTTSIEDDWFCYWSTKKYGYALRITGDVFTAAELEPAVDEDLDSATANDGTCEKSEVADFGDAAFEVDCSRKEIRKNGSFSSGYALASYRGAFGDTEVYCEVSSDEDSDLADIQSLLADFCALGVEAMSA